MRILRLTRHPAERAQLLQLRRIYGENTEVVDVSETVSGVDRIKELIEEHKADVLEAVLPLPILAQCVDSRNGVNIPVIRASMSREQGADGSVVFRFSHYERVVKVTIETERL